MISASIVVVLSLCGSAQQLLGRHDGGVVVAVGGAVALGVLTLTVPLALHAAVLEPDLHLAFGEVEVSRQLPALLLGHVRVEEELLLQFQGLELGVRFTLLAHRHVARPLQRVGRQRLARRRHCAAPPRHARGGEGKGSKKSASERTTTHTQVNERARKH